MAATLQTLQPAGGRHGERSDEKQQGKEEAEGRQEQAEGRARPLAVAVRSGQANPARPKPVRQEGLRIGRPGKPRGAMVPAATQADTRRDGSRPEATPLLAGVSPRSTSGK